MSRPTPGATPCWMRPRRTSSAIAPTVSNHASRSAAPKPTHSCATHETTTNALRPNHLGKFKCHSGLTPYSPSERRFPAYTAQVRATIAGRAAAHTAVFGEPPELESARAKASSALDLEEFASACAVAGHL